MNLILRIVKVFGIFNCCNCCTIRQRESIMFLVFTIFVRVTILLLCIARINVYVAYECVMFSLYHPVIERWIFMKLFVLDWWERRNVFDVRVCLKRNYYFCAIDSLYLFVNRERTHRYLSIIQKIAIFIFYIVRFKNTFLVIWSIVDSNIVRLNYEY